MNLSLLPTDLLGDPFNPSASLADIVVLVLVCSSFLSTHKQPPYLLQLNIRFKSLNLYQLTIYEVVGDRELCSNFIKLHHIYQLIRSSVYQYSTCLVRIPPGDVESGQYSLCPSMNMRSAPRSHELSRIAISRFDCPSSRALVPQQVGSSYTQSSQFQ